MRTDASQSGAISPFMFGLIIGMSVFSSLSLQWARQELVKAEQRRVERAQAQADDMAKSMEFSAMTETKDTYSEQFDLDRAKAYSNYTGGKTRGGQDMVVVSREDDKHTSFGDKNQRIAITATDDTLVRSKVYRASSAEDIAELSANSKQNQALATVDTSGVRQRQVLTSQRAMEGLAEQVYAFYGAHMRFPTGGEYEQIRRQFPFNDAWGEPFDYTYISDDAARLEFTTPWNYTQSLKLALKDDDGTTTPSPTTVSATDPVSDSQQENK